MSLRAITDAAFATVEGVAEQAAPTFSGRFAILLNDPTQRDKGLWESAGAPIEKTFNELAKTNAITYPGWQGEIQKVLACAREQARLETIYIPLFVSAQGQAKRVIDAGKKLTQDELHAVAVEGIDDGTSDDRPAA
jgi:hypothetical protein